MPEISRLQTAVRKGIGVRIDIILLDRHSIARVPLLTPALTPVLTPLLPDDPSPPSSSDSHVATVKGKTRTGTPGSTTLSYVPYAFAIVSLAGVWTTRAANVLVG